MIGIWVIVNVTADVVYELVHTVVVVVSTTIIIVAAAVVVVQ